MKETQLHIYSTTSEIVQAIKSVEENTEDCKEMKIRD